MCPSPAHTVIIDGRVRGHIGMLVLFFGSLFQHVVIMLLLCWPAWPTVSRLQTISSALTVTWLTLVTLAFFPSLGKTWNLCSERHRSHLPDSGKQVRCWVLLLTSFYMNIAVLRYCVLGADNLPKMLINLHFNKFDISLEIFTQVQTYKTVTLKATSLEHIVNLMWSFSFIAYIT